MIPHIRRVAVDEKKWLTDEDFKLGMSVCQLVPGATAMQVAAYVGLRTAGLLGAVTTFCSFGLAAFLFMTILSVIYFRYQNLPQLLGIFAFLKAIVAAIIVHSSMDMCKKYLHCLADKLLATLVAVFFASGIHPATILLGTVLITIIAWRTPSPMAVCPRRTSWGDAFRVACFLSIFLMLLWFVSKDGLGLAWLMMRIDSMAFGGGYASLPIMMHEVVDRLHWLSRDVFLDGIALGQLTPGPIVITATFVGYVKLGLWGALICTVAVFSPSFLFLVAVMPGCDSIFGSVAVRRGLQGCLISLAGLMAGMSANVITTSPWSIQSILLALLTFVGLVQGIKLHWFILLGLVWGILSV